MLTRTAISLLSSEKGRKAAGWVLTALLAPFILLTAFLCSLGSALAQHNASTVTLCFSNAPVPASVSAEYRNAVTSMRACFSRLDTSITNISAMMEEDGAGLDAVRIKAVFFALYFGEANPLTFDARAFADCFVTYEERTRLVPVESESDSDEEGENEPEMIEETYLVAVPIENLSIVYANIGALRGTSVSDEQAENIENVYSIARYGYVVPSGEGGIFAGADVPFIGTDGFCSPIGENWRSVVTSEFGGRLDPITGRPDGHRGMDLAVPTGTPIRAALGGVVTTAKYNAGGYGYYVMIDHGNGLVTLYAHCSQLTVQAGQTVSAGDVIALSGATGRVTGPHLHFEVRVNGSLTNPRSYLP